MNFLARLLEPGRGVVDPILTVLREEAHCTIDLAPEGCPREIASRHHHFGVISVAPFKWLNIRGDYFAAMNDAPDAWQIYIEGVLPLTNLPPQAGPECWSIRHREPFAFWRYSSVEWRARSLDQTLPQKLSKDADLSRLVIQSKGDLRVRVVAGHWVISARAAHVYGTSGASDLNLTAGNLRRLASAWSGMQRVALLISELADAYRQ